MSGNVSGKTGRYSFKDSNGVEWFVKGLSKDCGPNYAECWTADGKAVTVRQTEVLLRSGIHIPAEGIPLVRQEQEEADEGWTDAEILSEYYGDFTEAEQNVLAEYT